jgi:hypothetical protein
MLDRVTHNGGAGHDGGDLGDVVITIDDRDAGKIWRLVRVDGLARQEAQIDEIGDAGPVDRPSNHPIRLA